MRIATLLIIALIVTGTVSCADNVGRWENSAIPERAWAGEEEECRRRSAGVVEREFQQNRERRFDYERRSVQARGKMDRAGAGQRQQEIFNRCMTAKGFVLVPVDPQEEL